MLWNMAFVQSTVVKASPKRKRDCESPSYSPIISPLLPRINTNVREFPFFSHGANKEQSEGKSPQTVVAGHFEDLEIGKADRTHLGHAQKRMTQTTSDSREPSTSHESPVAPDVPTEISSQVSQPSTPSVFHFEANTFHDRVPEPSRRNSRSPPINGAQQENFWHESEITGYNPTDPNDDGYGINGIGFRPTPAIAWARSQRRKQQLAEYKSREAREARQRRIERRRVASIEMVPDREQEAVSKKQTRVHFEAQ